MSEPATPEENETEQESVNETEPVNVDDEPETPTAEQLVASAEAMMAQAKQMLELAKQQATSDDDTAEDIVVPDEEVEVIEPGVEIVDEGAAPEPIPADIEPVEAERDPLQPMDMRAELGAIRESLKARGFKRRADTGDHEVWMTTSPQGMEEYRATLSTDQTGSFGRLRLEIRDPRGFVMSEVNPAWPADVEIALAKL